MPSARASLFYLNFGQHPITPLTPFTAPSLPTSGKVWPAEVPAGSSFTANFRRTLPRQKQRYKKLNLARRHTQILNEFEKVLKDLFERTWWLCLDSRYY